MTLRRGFKSEAERMAAEQRRRLNIDITGPVDPFELLRSHGITVRTPRDVQAMAVMPADTLEILTVGASYWSAITVRTPAVVGWWASPVDLRPAQS